MSLLKSEIISALDVSLMTIPDTISFALLVGLSPSIGIITSIVMVIIGAFGGQPGLVSGSTAAVAISASSAVSRMGTRVLLPLVLLSGVIQLFAGMLGIDNLMRYIPRSVISGFLIGLSILMAIGQLRHFRKPESFASDDSSEWYSFKDIVITLVLTLIGVISIALQIYSGWDYVPPSIVAAIVISLIVYLLPKSIRDNNIRFVSDFGDTSVSPGIIHKIISDAYSGLSTIRLGDIIDLLPYALTMAGAGLVESLLTVKEVGLITGGGGNMRREVFTQGIANIASGLSGGQGGCVLVGQTMVHIGNGSRTRRSVLFIGIIIALFALFGSSIISNIPIPALLASVCFIIYKTFDWKAMKSLNIFTSHGWVLIITSLICILTHNLALGTIVGTMFHLFLKYFGI